MKKKFALILFVKAPVAGRVKTRLQPLLPPQFSLELHKAMAEDLVQRFSHQPDFDLFVFYDSRDHLPLMQSWLGSRYPLFAQKGDSLGEKMFNAFSQIQQKGYDGAAVIGSDLPDLSVETVQQCFRKLAYFNLVIGPSRDGGYYLIAGRHLPRALFQDISWSSPEVLSRTLQHARRLELSTFLLPEAQDIDEPEAVIALWQKLHHKEANQLWENCPATCRVLNRYSELLQNISLKMDMKNEY